jgi:hypothetical protein
MSEIPNPRHASAVLDLLTAIANGRGPEPVIASCVAALLLVDDSPPDPELIEHATELMRASGIMTMLAGGDQEPGDSQEAPSVPEDLLAGAIAAARASFVAEVRSAAGLPPDPASTLETAVTDVLDAGGARALDEIWTLAVNGSPAGARPQNIADILTNIRAQPPQLPPDKDEERAPDYAGALWRALEHERDQAARRRRQSQELEAVVELLRLDLAAAGFPIRIVTESGPRRARQLWIGPETTAPVVTIVEHTDGGYPCMIACEREIGIEDTMSTCDDRCALERALERVLAEPRVCAILAPHQTEPDQQAQQRAATLRRARRWPAKEPAAPGPDSSR